jgi:hypothetical protein
MNNEKQKNRMENKSRTKDEKNQMKGEQQQK